MKPEINYLIGSNGKINRWRVKSDMKIVDIYHPNNLFMSIITYNQKYIGSKGITKEKVLRYSE